MKKLKTIVFPAKKWLKVSIFEILGKRVSLRHPDTVLSLISLRVRGRVVSDSLKNFIKILIKALKIIINIQKQAFFV